MIDIRMAPTKIEFRLVDLKARKIIRDSSHYHATVERNDGVGTVYLNRDDCKALLYTGEKTADGTKIFDGDIIDAFVETERGQERMTDSVHWIDCAWRLGGLDGTLCDHVLISVKGNIYETPWPAELPTV